MTRQRRVAADAPMLPFDDFRTADIDTGATRIHARWAGSGPPVLLLHGFPQTHRMWRDVAPLLARDFTVVCADLRGYGRSGCPPSTDDHAPYAKRAMAQDMVALMAQLGFARFAVAGHDRGGRVAYRMALDHPDVVERIAVLDIVPTEAVWARADARLALAYWPWSLLAQPAPLPERLLAAAPEAFIDDALGGWGSPAAAFPQAVRDAYVDALRDPTHVHAICEEYRAAATIDRTHDQADLANGRRIACPLLVLWGTPGALDSWYVDEGGPLGLWRAWAGDVRGHAIEAGHFFPEEQPERTAELLGRFFIDASASIRGTAGYTEQADELVERYEAIGFEGRHAAVLHLLPDAPVRVLDIGAGSGADAAWFAERGDAVVAVEPTHAMRSRGMALHPSSSIEWIDDNLPGLPSLSGREESFDLVMLTAVWMHLDAREREDAMPRIASFVAPGGLMVMAIRHGPVPEGRVMFEVDAAETIAQAQACGLRAVFDTHALSVQAINRDAGVTWTRLAFRRAAA